MIRVTSILVIENYFSTVKKLLWILHSQQTSENEISRLKIDTDDVLVGKRLRVEGGLDQEMVSSFGGPVVFSNNINVLGEEGVQVST